MQRIPVWDILVRATHWIVALIVIAELVVLHPDSAIHRLAGYTAVALVALRLVWGVIGTRYARFSAFPPSLGAVREHLRQMKYGETELHLSHNPLGALMVYNLWATMIGLGITGYMMTTDRYWGVAWVANLHSGLADWVIISVTLHVAGVAYDMSRSKINLVRAMITGKKEIPGPGE